MEAKDTVMDNLAKAIIKHPDLPMGQAVAIEQAEITWDKAVREMVEWIEEHKLFNNRKTDAWCKWQDQKKVWGMDD